MSHDKKNTGHPLGNKPHTGPTPRVKEFIKPNEASGPEVPEASLEHKPGGTSPAESAAAKPDENPPATAPGQPANPDGETGTKPEDHKNPDGSTTQPDAPAAESEGPTHGSPIPGGMSGDTFHAPRGIRHGRLGSREIEEGSREAEDAEPECMTEARLAEGRAKQQFAKSGDAEPLKALGMVEVMEVVRWLMSEAAGDLPAIIGEYRAFRDATSLQLKWEALKAMGDIVVADVEDFPFDLAKFDKDRSIFQAQGSYEQKELDELEDMAEVKGVSLADVVNFVKEVLPLLLELIPWLRKR